MRVLDINKNIVDLSNKDIVMESNHFELEGYECFVVARGQSIMTWEDYPSTQPAFTLWRGTVTECEKYRDNLAEMMKVRSPEHGMTGGTITSTKTRKAPDEKRERVLAQGWDDSPF